MQIWVLAISALLILGIVISKKRKAANKSKVREALKRLPLRPAPFDILSLESTGSSQLPRDTETTGTIQAYEAYCTTYKRLLQGEAAQDIADYAHFVPASAREAHDANALDAFIRTAFQSDVLFGYLELEFERNLKSSVDKGIAEHWLAGLLGEAALIAFRRTQEVRYLELYRRFFDRFMMLRDTELGYYDDYHETEMNAWGAYNLGKNAGKPGLWVAHITHFSVCVLPATGFARDILSNPTLTAHHSWAVSVVDFFQQAYKQFDTDYRDVDGVTERWYWRPLLDKYEATNHMHLQGQVLLNLYAVTKDDFYADRIRSFLRIFEKGVTIHDDGLASWNYSPYFQVANEKNGHISRQYSEYTWKGEITAPFLYEAKADGFDINPDVLAGVTSSIRDHILKDADYKLHVHPQGSRPIAARDRKKSGFIECGISGYHAAAAEDAIIEQHVIDVVAAAPALFPVGWFSHPRLSRSYARLLPASS